MKKQLQQIVLAFIMVLATLTTYAQEVGETFSVDHITYKITSVAPYEVEAADYTGTGGVVTISPTVDHGPNTYKVNRIGDGAFRDNALTSVSIPNSVTSIGSGAFFINQLSSITLPNSVTSIDDYAFRDNALTSVTLPNSVTHIGRHAFRDNALIEVTIPNSVTSIGSGAFADNNLTEATLPNSVTRIGDYAFYSNDLTEVTIPNSVISIGDAAFFINQLSSITLPNSVTSIGDYAFYNNPNLDTVVSKGTDSPSIQTYTFSNRHQIDLAVPRGKKQEYLDNGWTGFRSITEPAEVGDTFSVDHITYKVTSLIPLKVEATDYNTAGGPIVSIPPTVNQGQNIYTVAAIGAEAFSNNQLTSVTIPNGVTSIQQQAFENNQLTSVTIPNSVTSIGLSAFNSNQLTSVTIPNSVTSIKDYVFAGNQLTEVTIPGNVTSIGGWAFAVNPNLVTVIVEPSNPPTLHEDAFQDLINNIDFRHQIDVIVPKGKRQLYLDNGWTSFKSITEVVEVGDTLSVDHITYKVTSLTPLEVEATDYNTEGGSIVSIPQTVDQDPNTFEVTRIDGGAFRNNNLTSVTIPNSVTTIGDSAFRANKLTGVTIPGSVTSIGDRAFEVNELTEVTIPNSVTTIGDKAFDNNRDLATVVTKATVPPTLHEDAFSRANRDQIDLIVPLGTKDTYLAEGWTSFKSITEAAIVAQDAVVQSTSAKTSTSKSTRALAYIHKGNERNNIVVYPNPAQDSIHIRLGDDKVLHQVNIYNTLGVHIYSANALQIDISHLPRGIYILEIETKTGEKVVKRVMIQ